MSRKDQDEHKRTITFGAYKKPDPIYTKLRQDVEAKHGAKAIQGKWYIVLQMHTYLVYGMHRVLFKHVLF